PGRLDGAESAAGVEGVSRHLPRPRRSAARPRPRASAGAEFGTRPGTDWPRASGWSRSGDGAYPFMCREAYDGRGWADLVGRIGGERWRDSILRVKRSPSRTRNREGEVDSAR